MPWPHFTLEHGSRETTVINFHVLMSEGLQTLQRSHPLTFLHCYLLACFFILLLELELFLLSQTLKLLQTSNEQESSHF